MAADKPETADPNEWIANDEISDCLKKLTKLILKAFYSIEHSLVGSINHNYVEVCKSS